MRELLYLLRDLCQLKRGPQDMPYAPTLLGALIGINVTVLLAYGQIKEQDLLIPRAIFATALMLGALYGLLSARDLRSRFVQTAIAVLGSTIVFDLLLLPILFVMLPVPATAADWTPQKVMLLWVAVGLGIWRLTVAAHILRHALAVRLAAGFLLVVLWVIGSAVLSASVFGGSA